MELSCYNRNNLGFMYRRIELFRWFGKGAIWLKVQYRWKRRIVCSVSRKKKKQQIV